jgi:phage baseplate assembly protein W
MADFGTDIAGTTDLDSGLSLVSGERVLAEALVRRLTTPRGALFYAPDYGSDVRELLLARVDARALAAWRARIEGECVKDERVDRARAAIDFDFATETATISVAITSADRTFRLTVSVSALSVELLTVG